MLDYVIKRVLLMAPSLIGVSIILFLVMHMVPGDVVMAKLAESGSFRAEDAERMREQLGLNRPLWEQYLVWISGVARGDLGQSLWTQKPVTQEIWARLPVTAEIALVSIVTSIGLALVIGVLSAVRQDTFIDYAARFMSILGLSIPDFWIATMLILVPLVWWGYMPVLSYIPFTEDPVENLKQFLPPALALGARLSASVMRITRSSLLEVLRQDYIRTAWAKGLQERTVVSRHALKNALIPVITVLGTQFSRLLGGTVVEETIFGLPGIGRLTLESIVQRDFIMLEGCVLFLAAIFLVMNLLIDLSYAWLDPRIRY